VAQVDWVVPDKEVAVHLMTQFLQNEPFSPAAARLYQFRNSDMYLPMRMWLKAVI
jgi:hypothetical protein